MFVKWKHYCFSFHRSAANLMSSLHHGSCQVFRIRASPVSPRLPEVSGCASLKSRGCLGKPRWGGLKGNRGAVLGVEGRGLGKAGATRRGSVKVMAAVEDLLIVGPGVLGSYLGKLWIDHGGKVIGQTLSKANHDR